MELDLTRLNRLSFADFKEDKSNGEAPKTPAETIIPSGATTADTAKEKPMPSQNEATEGLNKLQRQADNRKEAIDRSLAVYQQYQHNIMISSQLHTEILKGAKEGADIYTLFLKAVKAISLMTSDSLFYTQLEGDIRTIYGQGLLEATPLQMEIQDAEERIAKLKEALERDIEPRARDRILISIKAHEAKKAELESLIQRNTTA